MLAILLYLAVAIALIAVWRKYVHPISNAASLVLVLIPFCFTGRALLTGRVYGPIDLPMMSEPLSNYAADYGVEAAHNPGLSDLYMQLMPWQSAVRHAVSQGAWPVWNPYLLCGSILAANMQAAPYDAVQLVGMLLPHPQALTFAAAMTFFLGALFTFAFARTLGCGEVASLVAAGGYTFCALIAFFVGWPLGRVWTFLPLVLLGVRLIVRETGVRAGVILTSALVLTIFAGHPESILHIVFCGAIYGSYEVIVTKRFRAIAWAALCGVLALLLTAISLLPFFAVAPHTMEYAVRHNQYATAAFDIPAKAVLERATASLFPFASGPGSTHWDASPMRVGSVILALALLALFVTRKRRDTWFFFGFFLVMACAGLNAFPIGDLLHALPLFDIALNDRLGFAAVFALCVLAAFAVDAWPASHRKYAILPLALGIALFVGAVLVTPEETGAGADAGHVAIMILAELTPLVLLAALFALRVSPRYALPAILGLLLLQRVAEDGAMYPTLPEKVFYPEIPILRHMQNDAQTPFRMVGLYYALIPDSAALYGLEDARGYEAMTFQRLHETYPLWSRPQPVSFNIVVDKDRPFLSFLNVKYALGSLDQQESPNWKLVLQDRQSRLFENRTVLPRAFVPHRVRYQQTDDGVLRGMQQTTDFGDLAWLLVPQYLPHEIANGPGTLITKRDGLAYDIDATMEGDGWVVISDSKWPGWRAYIDGRRVETHYANHAFVGVYVPKGHHTLRVVFQPEAFTRGRNVTVATMVVLIGFFVWTAATRVTALPRDGSESGN